MTPNAKSTYPKRIESGIREVSKGIFEVQVFIGRDPLTGATRSTSKRIQGIQNARRLKNEMHAAIKTRSKSGKNFGDVLDEWLDVGWRSWSASYYAETERKIFTVIKPALGRIKLGKLDAKTLNAFYRQLSEGQLMINGTQRSPISGSSVAGYHRTIRAALNYAVDQDLLPYNPAPRTSQQIRKAEKKEIPCPTSEEVRILIQVARMGYGPEGETIESRQLATLIQFSAHLGTRRGELCAVRWGDVSFSDRTVTIRHSIASARGETSLKGTKTNTVREVPFGPNMAERLLERYRDSVELAKRFDVEISDDSFVFSLDPTFQDYLLPDSLTHIMQRHVRRTEHQTEQKFPFSIKSLRHYCATELMAQGFSAIDVAKRLGHSSAELVLRTYGHATDAKQREMAAALD